MRKRDQRYKLPKNHIVIPLIIYTVLFAIVAVLTSVAINFLASYGAQTKADAEIDKTVDYADLYDLASGDEIKALYKRIAQSGKGTVYTKYDEPDSGSDGIDTALEEKADALFDRFEKSGYDFVIADNDANLICSYGENTALLDKVEEYGYSDNLEEQLNDYFNDDESQEEMKENTRAFLINLDQNIRYYPDKDTKYIEIQDMNFDVHINEMITDDDLIKKIYRNEGTIPYWTAFRVKDNTQIIAFKTTFTFKASDVYVIFMFAAAAYLLEIIIFIILVVNILRTHRNNRKMRKLVFKDEITGNRNWFWFALTGKQLIRRRKGDTRYALVSLSFVRYRNYVLCHSIELGENTLRLIWQTIDGSLEKKEICAHSGISNFPMLIKANDEQQAEEKVMTIIKRLEKIGGDHDFKFQAGICMIDPAIKKNADIDLLYNNASTARMTLDDTDDTGIAFFGDKLVEDEKWIDMVTERQRDAIEKEEFTVYYQPKYDPRTDELMGAEALIRWNSKDLGFVSPGRFIPLFEKSGFITEIDHFMVSHVARDQKKWLDEGRKCVPVSVNISRAHFSETNLAEQIRDMVDKEGTPHDLIEIELTESAFFDDKKLMLSTITKLKEYGFLVSMDDFGSGYSSLNSLKDMPLDILKLDAGFFKGDMDNERTEIVVSEAIRLAKKLNMQTVAEGVEDKEQVDFLAAEGCNMIQGYYYAKPMPKEEYEQRINVNAQPEVKEQAEVKEHVEVDEQAEAVEQPEQTDQPEQIEQAEALEQAEQPEAEQQEVQPEQTEQAEQPE